MTKAVFFNIPAKGHVNPTLPLVRELIRRDVRVIYVDTEALRTLIEPTGATFVPYPDAHGDPGLASALERIAGGSIPGNALAFHQLGLGYLPFCLDLLERERPDVVIHDSVAEWGWHAANRLGIPTIGSITTFVLTPWTLPAISFITRLIAHLQILWLYPAFLKVKRAMRRQFGIDIGTPMSSMFSASRVNLVYTLRELQPNAHLLGEAYHFIGAAIGERYEGDDFPFERLDGRRLITISLGTINNQNPEFYRHCFTALGDSPYQVVMAVGGSTDLKQLGPIPSNFLVRPFVPQLPLLERSDLFITHAGMNSVHESLWFGVPMLAIPQQFEQAIVARQVEQSGAGKALAISPPIGRVSAAELRAAVEELMAKHSGFQARCRVIGQSLRAAGGAERGAEVILESLEESAMQNL